MENIESQSCLTCNCTLYDTAYVKSLEKKAKRLDEIHNIYSDQSLNHTDVAEKIFKIISDDLLNDIELES